MKRVTLFGATCAGVLLAGAALAADVKSGPQAGQNVPGPFHPLNVTGDNAGQKFCLV